MNNSVQVKKKKVMHCVGVGRTFVVTQLLPLLFAWKKKRRWNCFVFRDTRASKRWHIPGYLEMRPATETFTEPCRSNWKKILPNLDGNKLITLPPLYVRCNAWLWIRVPEEVKVPSRLEIQPTPTQINYSNAGHDLPFFFFFNTRHILSQEL